MMRLHPMTTHRKIVNRIRGERSPVRQRVDIVFAEIV
jgi:hypothetical protein